MKNHYLSFLLLLLVEGVFSDVMMSVMEGDSVTLQIDVTQIQGAETLLWMFNGQSKFIAKIDREYNKIITVPPKNVERFRNRLQVDQIGSLTITNIRTEDSGLYTLGINSSVGIPYKNFRVTVNRVSDVETKTVIKGESVTLQTDLTGLQTVDELQWSYFTPEETRIARVTIETGNKNITLPNVSKIFNDRLNVDSKTGNLIISDVTTEHSGLYKLEINRSQTKPKMFRVTVIERSPVVPDPRPSPGAIAGICTAVAVLLLVVIGIFWYRHKIKASAVKMYNRCCKNFHFPLLQAL
ncbi:uncharacterized protein LOC127639611 isoform X2 [Xyrauchen texanus]|uniref:uncharacterized protein LOC127639611 isoform X1 n=1 Tax=Xyrauchen texanus TaxID=154827 RepID=UPI002242659D|nr:uncharacterized protein LOC127639611 isoform X1 [Xyrauchen texanus]XP_051977681.1 uncharacterized protein LOC127639611 isoform X2 [Xyrauchen texanus]